MAAIECAGCGAYVDQDATKCPTCGGDPRTGEGAVDPTDSPQAPSEAAGGSSVQVDTLPSGAWLALFGGLLMALGSFLPWMQASTFLVTIHRNGMQLGENMGFSVDGVVTLILGVVTCVIGLSRLLHFGLARFFYRLTVITGLIAGAITVYNATQLHTFVASIGNESVKASLGYGLWVLLVGCALAIVGGFIVRVATKPELAAAVTESAPVEQVSMPQMREVAVGGPSVADELSKLAGLMERGLLTEDEFEAQKAKLLG